MSTAEKYNQALKILADFGISEEMLSNDVEPSELYRKNMIAYLNRPEHSYWNGMCYEFLDRFDDEAIVTYVSEEAGVPPKLVKHYVETSECWCDNEKCRKRDLDDESSTESTDESVEEELDDELVAAKFAALAKSKGFRNLFDKYVIQFERFDDEYVYALYNEHGYFIFSVTRTVGSDSFVFKHPLMRQLVTNCKANPCFIGGVPDILTKLTGFFVEFDEMMQAVAKIKLFSIKDDVTRAILSAL